MNWQVIILTLGASLITGIISLLGNIIISKASIKRTLIKNEIKNKKQFIDKREKAYNEIIDTIKAQLVDIEGKVKPYDEQKKLIDNVWRTYYHYCGKSVNKNMVLLIEYFDNSFSSKQRINRLCQIMKKDIDRFYGIKDKLYKQK